MFNFTFPNVAYTLCWERIYNRLLRNWLHEVSSVHELALH